MDEMFFVVISKAGCLITSFLETPRIHILIGYYIMVIGLNVEASQELMAYTNST